MRLLEGRNRQGARRAAVVQGVPPRQAIPGERRCARSAVARKAAAATRACRGTCGRSRHTVRRAHRAGSLAGRAAGVAAPPRASATGRRGVLQTRVRRNRRRTPPARPHRLRTLLPRPRARPRPRPHRTARRARLLSRRRQRLQSASERAYSDSPCREFGRTTAAARPKGQRASPAAHPRWTRA